MIMDAHDAAQLLQQMQNKHILVIGDLMLDRFIDGTVARISPEAPVPILSNTHITTMPGGAANVARNICHLGARCTLIGITGEDEASHELKDALSALAGLTFAPYEMANRPTTTKTRFRAGAQQIMRLDDECTTPLESSEVQDFFDVIHQYIQSSDIVILSDYAKGALPPSLIKNIIAHAKQENKKVIIDPKSHDFRYYEGAFLITPNLSELRLATPLADETDETISKAAQDLATAYNIDHILTTLSARGMRLDGKDHRFHIPSLTKKVFDVSGAGDTVVAALSCAIAAEASLTDAMVFANQAASIVVSKPGTAAFCAGELIASSRNGQDIATSLEAQEDQIDEWRNSGIKIGFTNGCFDLLHAGHIHVLREASKTCDKLIVGLNSDASVKALKGSHRPIQNQEERAFVLMQLGLCDAVIIFEEETPARLITALSPDVLIKGGDYEVEHIVGFDHVTKKGGEVLTIPLLEGHSTTAFLKG